MIDALIRDFSYAVRMLAANPGFACVAAGALALGIGANTAIFTVANAVLLSPLPYSHPDRLALVATANPSQGAPIGVFSFPRFEFIQRHNRTFSGIAAFANESFNLTGQGDPEQIAAARVSASFFDVLGVRAMRGRTFLAEEDRPGGKDVAVISHALWMRRFAGNPAISGQTITLNSRPFTIAGVLPAGFEFGYLGSTVDIWAPRVFELNLATPEQVRAGSQYLNAVARLAPGRSMRQAQAEMEVLNREYLQEFPKMADANPKLTITLNDLRDRLVAGVRPAVLILSGAVGLVLLIACANVASLLLSRALGRKKEIAVRTALGASRSALVRQLLVESMLLALLGGALGVLLSIWGTRALALAAQTKLPRAAEIQTGVAVLAFSGGISLLTGLLFGLLPALQISRADVNSGLRQETRGTTGGRTRNRFRASLVVAQVALSTILLIAAGLLIRSFAQLLSVRPGFEAAGVLTMAINLPPAKYTDNARMISFFDELQQRMSHSPGVLAVAVSSALPMNPSRFAPVLPEGHAPVPFAQRPVVAIQTISPTYFAAMRTPLLRGRAFKPSDGAHDAPVAIVNETFVKRFWAGANPLGKHIAIGRALKSLEVAGVAGDIKNLTLAGEPLPEIYIPYPQLPWRTMNLLIRTTGDPHRLASAARAQVQAVDSGQPVTAVQTLEELLESSRAQPKMTMRLLVLFSAAALLLAALGLYGTISYSVAQRTQELGIRIALGAGSGDIAALVMRQGMLLTLAGLIAGLIAALALTRVLGSLLYKMTATDPATFFLSALLFGAVASLASYLPSRRAMQVDPAISLRQG